MRKKRKRLEERYYINSIFYNRVSLIIAILNILIANPNLCYISYLNLNEFQIEKNNVINEEQIIIERYIIKSHSEIIPFEELEQLKDSELYYLYNGIYAYNGMFFLEEELNQYFNSFEWYEMKYDTTELVWCDLNYYQRKTLSYINLIREKRRDN